MTDLDEQAAWQVISQQTNKQNKGLWPRQIKSVLESGQLGQTFKVRPYAGVIRNKQSVEDIAGWIVRDSIQILGWQLPVDINK